MSIEIKNGWHWKAPDPYLHDVITQWLDKDIWVLMAAPYQSYYGGTAQMPISDPDGSGKIFYTQKELALRLENSRYVRIENRILILADECWDEIT